MFNFETRKTQVAKLLGIWSFPLVTYADIFAQIFFYLFVISLVVFGISFLGFTFLPIIIKLPIIFFLLFVIFLEIDMFAESVVKKPRITLKLADAVANPENYNLA